MASRFGTVAVFGALLAVSGCGGLRILDAQIIPGRGGIQKLMSVELVNNSKNVRIKMIRVKVVDLATVETKTNQAGVGHRLDLSS